MPGETQTDPTTEQPESNETFETWLATQDDKVKGLYTTHTASLRSALDGERAATKTLQAQLRDLAKKADKGSELESELLKQAEQLGVLSRKAAFQDSAHSAGVKNLNLAFIAAQEAGLIGANGECDFAKLRKLYPELWPAQPSANAGEGAQNTTGKTDMNQVLRQAFGRP